MTTEPGPIRVRYVRTDAEHQQRLRGILAELQAKSILRYAASQKDRQGSEN